MRRVPVLVASLLGVCLFTACPRKPVTVPPAVPTPTPAPTPVPQPTPPPLPYVPDKRMEVGKMFNGAQVRASLETELGGSATEVRREAGSYEVEVIVHHIDLRIAGHALGLDDDPLRVIRREIVAVS